MLTRRQQLPIDHIRTLFRDSGYLALRPCPVDQLDRWLTAKTESQDRVYVAADETLLGHVSVTPAYRCGTWLGHQLTTIKGHSESWKAREALYHFFASVPAPDDFLIGYYDPTKRWHRLFFEQFVNPLCTTFRWERFECNGSYNLSRYSRNLRRLDRCAALAFLRCHARLPPLAMAAYGWWDPTDLLWPPYCIGVENAWGLCGVACCYIGPPASLFGLTRMACVVFSDSASQALRETLLSATSAYYARHAIDRPIIVSPPGQVCVPWLDSVEAMGGIVWRGRALPAYKVYVSKVLAKVQKK